MKLDRRLFVAGGAALASGAAAAATRPFAPQFGPRSRVLLVNDIAGDIDGLFSTVHALLATSTDLRGIIGTKAALATETPQEAVALAHEILKLMRLSGKVPVFEGATARISEAGKPVSSAGTQAIIAEAMRSDSPLPLYVTVGGGLTEVASALMIEPSIAGKFTLVWIGGGPPDGSAPLEYNFGIDPLAAMHVFNNSDVPIWQIPSDVYAQCMVSNSEIQAHVAPCGEIGDWLYHKLQSGGRFASQFKLNTGETWTLGDSPLVLLTALTAWNPVVSGRMVQFNLTGSSRFEQPWVPELSRGGIYTPRTSGRKMRLYRTIDTRMMFGDFFARIRMNYAK